MPESPQGDQWEHICGNNKSERLILLQVVDVTLHVPRFMIQFVEQMAKPTTTHVEWSLKLVQKKRLRQWITRVNAVSINSFYYHNLKPSSR